MSDDEDEMEECRAMECCMKECEEAMDDCFDLDAGTNESCGFGYGLEMAGYPANNICLPILNAGIHGWIALRMKHLKGPHVSVAVQIGLYLCVCVCAK